MSVKSTLKLILPTLKLILPTLNDFIDIKVDFSNFKVDFTNFKADFTNFKVGKTKRKKITKWHQEASVGCCSASIVLKLHPHTDVSSRLVVT